MTGLRLWRTGLAVVGWNLALNMIALRAKDPNTRVLGPKY